MVGCLLSSLAFINDQWDGSLDKCKVGGLVPCCGQDGYRAQVLQHPIDSYRFISISLKYVEKSFKDGECKKSYLTFFICNNLCFQTSNFTGKITNHFTFSKIFKPETDQKLIFSDIVMPRIKAGIK